MTSLVDLRRRWCCFSYQSWPCNVRAEVALTARLVPILRPRSRERLEDSLYDRYLTLSQPRRSGTTDYNDLPRQSSIDRAQVKCLQSKCSILGRRSRRRLEWVAWLHSWLNWRHQSRTICHRIWPRSCSCRGLALAWLNSMHLSAWLMDQTAHRMITLPLHCFYLQMHRFFHGNGSKRSWSVGLSCWPFPPTSHSTGWDASILRRAGSFLGQFASGDHFHLKNPSD